MSERTKAPSDAKAGAAYEQLLKTAEGFGLIVHAYGGVATLAVPEEQRKAGVRQRVLDAALLSED